jgi:hypothetical protein
MTRRFLYTATILATTALALVAATNSEIKLTKQMEQRWQDRGYQLFEHDGNLVMLNRSQLRLEVLDPVTGATITQDRLNTKAQDPKLLTTLETTKGEFLIGLARFDRTIELHALDSDVSYEVGLPSQPTHLQLIELEGNQVYVIVTFQDSIRIFKRTDDALELMHKMAVAGGIRQARAVVNTKAQMDLIVLGKDKKIHVMALSKDFEQAKERLTYSKAVDQFVADYDDQGHLLLSVINGNQMTILLPDHQLPPRTVAVDTAFGNIEWLRLDNRNWRISYVTRVQGATRVQFLDPFSPAKPVSFLAADSTSVRETWVHTGGKKPYFGYNSEQKQLVMHLGSSQAIASSKMGEHIVSTLPMGKNQVAVLLEGDRGTRLQIVQLQ